MNSLILSADWFEQRLGIIENEVDDLLINNP